MKRLYGSRLTFMDSSKKAGAIDSIEQGRYNDLLGVADFYLDSGDYDLAQEFYNRASAVGPNDGRAYVGLGTIALGKNWLSEAEVAFEMAAWINEDSYEAYCGLGKVHQRRRDMKRAYKMYLKSLKINPENITAVLGLFRISLAMSSFAKSEHYLRLYLNAHPCEIRAMFCLGILYIRQQKFDRAEDILGHMLVIEPNDMHTKNLGEELSFHLNHAEKSEVAIP
jgi:Tfp pilus assembly protein PilF